MMCVSAAAMTGLVIGVEMVRRRQVRELTRTIDYLRGRNQELWHLYLHNGGEQP